jgi:hypothetical protein
MDPEDSYEIHISITKIRKRKNGRRNAPKKVSELLQAKFPTTY